MYALLYIRTVLPSVFTGFRLILHLIRHPEFTLSHFMTVLPVLISGRSPIKDVRYRIVVMRRASVITSPPSRGRSITDLSFPIFHLFPFDFCLHACHAMSKLGALLSGPFPMLGFAGARSAELRFPLGHARLVGRYRVRPPVGASGCRAPSHAPLAAVHRANDADLAEGRPSATASRR